MSERNDSGLGCFAVVAVFVLWVILSAVGARLDRLEAALERAGIEVEEPR